MHMGEPHRKEVKTSLKQARELIYHFKKGKYMWRVDWTKKREFGLLGLVICGKVNIWWRLRVDIGY